MKTDNPLKLGISEALKTEGFSRNGDTWVCDDSEAILLVHLQKSNFGKQYYLGLGIYMKRLGGHNVVETPLKEHQCHVRIRIDSLAGARKEWNPILDLDDTTLARGERQSRVDALIRRFALPWLRTCGTREGLRIAQQNGLLQAALVDKRVRDAINSGPLT